MANELILIVDDNALNLKVARVLLTSEGYVVRTATSGDDMYRALETFEPRLILMDIQLPGKSGLELVRELKSDPSRKNIPIIALTAYAMKGDEERALAAGCDGYVTKPIDPDSLPGTIAGILSGGALGEGEAAPKQGAWILVVEDNEITRKMVRVTLELEGFQVLTAGDGRTALGLVKEYRPCLALVDLRLPDMDGCELAKAIRLEQGMHEATLLAFTGFVEGGKEESVAKAGFNGSIMKPVEPSVLVSLVRRHLGKRPLQEDLFNREDAMKASLSRQCSLQSAALSVLSTISGSVSKSADIELALPEILLACLDGVGLSSGAIYLSGPQQAYRLCAQLGFSSVQIDRVNEIVQRLRSQVESGSTILLSYDRPMPEIGPELLRAANLHGALLVPLVSRGHCLGLMILSLDSEGVEYEYWSGYAATVASQLAQAITLSRVISNLAESEDRYRNLMKHALDGISVLNLEGRILEVNPSMAAMLGRDELEVVGRYFAEFAGSEEHERIQKDFARLMTEGKTKSRGVRLLQHSGKAVHADFSTNVITMGGRPTVLAIAHDMTEREEAEEQLRQSQKMEAVGLLSGGIAHDFNNMLAVIMMHCDSLAEVAASDARTVSETEGIRRTAERAASLTRQLLVFSRKQILDPKVVDLRDLISEVEQMLRRLIGEDIRLEVGCEAGLNPVKIDSNQFDQVVMNLAVNARDAMPKGGTLTLAARNVELQSDPKTVGRELAPGSYVMLTVTDTGKGMEAGTLKRIFEPFFTTKAPGRGTGLGLSTVIGIVRHAGGDIAVTSEVGKGTEFKVYFPASQGKVERPVSVREKLLPQRGSETILVVEDEPDLRELTVALLQESGYTVLEARDGSEALALCLQSRDKIDLVMTDVLMPNMSGPEFVRKASESGGKPLRALFLSGYAAGDLASDGLPEGGFHFLEKPYSRNALLAKIREVLVSK